MEILNSFVGRSIILNNQREQTFIINQQTEDEKISIYKLKRNGAMEIIYSCNGIIYDDTPLQHEHYMKSKIHFIDKKNDRIIFVKCEAQLSNEPGYPSFTIVGLDYNGKDLFYIEIDEELEPISIHTYKNGDLLLLGNYNKWLGKNSGKSYNCIMRIAINGNIIWKKAKELSCNEFDGTYQVWDYKDNENFYHEVSDWGKLFLTSDDKILIETVDGNSKSIYKLFTSDKEFNADLEGKSLYFQKIRSDSLIQVDESYITIVENSVPHIIRSIFDNDGKKLSEEKIFLNSIPQKVDINIQGIAALYPGYIK